MKKVCAFLVALTSILLISQSANAHIEITDSLKDIPQNIISNRTVAAHKHSYLGPYRVKSTYTKLSNGKIREITKCAESKPCNYYSNYIYSGPYS